MRKLRILLADDHIVMRSGPRALLERQPHLEVVGESENERYTIELVASLKLDVVVMDIGMPVLNGIEATKTIVTEHPTTAIIILRMHADESYVMRASGKSASQRFKVNPAFHAYWEIRAAFFRLAAESKQRENDFQAHTILLTGN